MNGKSKARRVKVPAFSVGGKVYVPFGKKKRVARIIEDRGMIGRGGRRLLRVVFTDSEDQFEQAFEIPAAEVTHAPSRSRRSSKAKAA